MRQTAFDLFHPAVALTFFVALLILSMAAMQPVYLLVSFSGAVAYSFVLRGPHATLRSLAWQVPLVIILALANILLSTTGSIELIRIGPRVFYLESLVYGACMGLMLACTLLTFSNATRVLTMDKIVALFGNVLPTVSLMMSMTARLVPQLMRRGREISSMQRACTAARTANCAGEEEGMVHARAAHATTTQKIRRHVARRSIMRDNLRLSSVLMGWSMEGSLETAATMRARGWGARVRRTTYVRHRFRWLDGLACAVVGGLAVACAACAWMACGRFSFYPAVDGFAPWLSYLPYVLFVALPLIAEAKERAVWRA